MTTATNVRRDRDGQARRGAPSGVPADILSHRETLSKLTGYDMETVEQIAEFALALQYAHGLFLSGEAPLEDIKPLIERGVAIRDRFYGLATGLAHWEIFPAERVAAMRSGNSFRNVGEDLISIGSLFQSKGPEVYTRCPATAENVAEALSVGEQIMAAVGLRDHHVQEASEASADRRRAFALLDRAYDEARRGLTYVRWHEGDVDEIAPSLHALPAASKKEKPAVVAPASPIATPVTPVVAAPKGESTETPTGSPVPKSNPFKA